MEDLPEEHTVQTCVACAGPLSDPPGGGRGHCSRFCWHHDGCTCDLGPGWPGRLEANTCPHTQRPKGDLEAEELCPDRPHPAATGASRPSGGFPRWNLSPARADRQRRSGAAPTSPGPAHTHRLASLSGVSWEPVLARGPLQKTKKGSVISFRDAHPQGFVPPQGTKATISFPR